MAPSVNPSSVFVNINGAVYEFPAPLDPRETPVNFDSVKREIQEIVSAGGVFRHSTKGIETFIRLVPGQVVQVLTAEAFEKWMAQQEQAHRQAQLMQSLPMGKLRSQ